MNIEYNNRYQIKKHDWKLNGSTITGYNYGHDSVGNRTWSENIVTPNKSELLAFDNADRLTSFKTGTLNGTKTAITSQTYSQNWVLDNIGNWSQFNDNGVNSVNAFTDTHEMTTFKGVTNTFDNNGNLTSDGVRTFKYDAFNRIIQVKIGAVVLANYQYDAFNRRVLKQVDADLNGSFETSVKFLYDGFRCIEELNGSDALVKEYVWGGLYVDELILQRTIATATDYYFTHDYRYSVTSLTNSAGNIEESYDYKVYGERTASGSGLTDFGYTGQRHDAETGLMYFKNRYYSVSMGQFVTRDPLGFVDGMSMYLGYFGGQDVDPDGQEIISKEECSKVIKEYLDKNKVKGYNDNKGTFTGKATFDKSASESEILGQMINSPRKFTLAGDTPEEQLANLIKHVEARKSIANGAVMIKRGNFQFTDVNQGNILNLNYWDKDYTVKEGVSATDALNNLVESDDLYRMKCYDATLFVVLYGISKGMGKKDFDEKVHWDPIVWKWDLVKRDLKVAGDDWILGDWGYVKNGSTGVIKKGEEGENIIYLGSKDYFGHGGYPKIKTLKGWQKTVGDWNIKGSLADVKDHRDRPRVGLKD